MVALDVTAEIESDVMSPTIWRLMTQDDVEIVYEIANQIHPNYPERIEVFQERLRLYPHGCYVFEQENVLVGYVISHPWHPMVPPQLDSLVVAMPTFPATYYIHDLALLPQARGTGAGTVATKLLVEHAQDIGLTDVSLVAVNGSAAFWNRHGFFKIENESIAGLLASYDDEACFMIHKLDTSDVL